MEKILSFLRSLWYNIVHDKLYSIFYVLGTAIAFMKGILERSIAVFQDLD